MWKFVGSGIRGEGAGKNGATQRRSELADAGRRNGGTGSISPAADIFQVAGHGAARVKAFLDKPFPLGHLYSLNHDGV
jgi:hypothetical protein